MKIKPNNQIRFESTSSGITIIKPKKKLILPKDPKKR